MLEYRLEWVGEIIESVRSQVLFYRFLLFFRQIAKLQGRIQTNTGSQVHMHVRTHTHAR